MKGDRAAALAATQAQQARIRAEAVQHQQINQLTERCQRLLAALEGTYSLAIGWAGHYQHQHHLTKTHPLHEKLLAAARAELETGKAPTT